REGERDLFQMRIMLLVFCSMGGLEYDYNESLSWCVYIDASTTGRLSIWRLASSRSMLRALIFVGLMLSLIKHGKVVEGRGILVWENALAQ
ncbi:hypothetical protein, partial [Pseudomonas aeruginosa]|uniref:hypothetical protein n=1 Tax=Pseudomonas aeruginosa TaxID=287 RepID=UPI001EDCA73B